MMQTGVPEDYLSFYTMMGQEIFYHLLYLFAIGAVSHSVYRFMTVWYSESSRGPGMWPVKTLWWANARPSPVGQGRQQSYRVLAKPITDGGMIAAQGWKGPLCDYPVWLLSLIPRVVDCLKMSSDGELLPRKLIPHFSTFMKSSFSILKQILQTCFSLTSFWF